MDEGELMDKGVGSSTCATLGHAAGTPPALARPWVPECPQEGNARTAPHCVRELT